MNIGMNLKGGPTAASKLGSQNAGPKSLGKSLRRLLGYKKGSAPLIILTLLIAGTGTVMQVITPKMLGRATSVIVGGITAQTGIDLAALGRVLLVVGALYLGTFGAGFLQQRLMTVVSLKTTATLRNAVKAKLNRTPIAYFDRNATGNLMSIAVNDIDNITTNLQQSLTQLLSSVILLVGTLMIMLTISPLLTLLACVMIPASTLIAKLFTPIARKHNKIYVQSMGAVNSSIEETYQNFTVVKSFNGEQDRLDVFRQANAAMCQAGWRAKFFGGSMMHFMMLVQKLGSALAAQAVIDTAEDVFFLLLEELAAAVPGDLKLQERVAKRKQAFAKVCAAQEKGIHWLIATGSFPEFQAKPKKEQAAANGSASLKGSPASQGVVEGPVCIVRSPAEFGKLKKGDILVAPYTSPDWTPLFKVAAAVVTEVGSAGSHAAIVAREYGIPAVAAVDQVTQRLQDGQRIRVDGTRGTVTFLKDQETTPGPAGESCGGKHFGEN